MKVKLGRYALILGAIILILSSTVVAFALSGYNLFSLIYEMGDEYIAEGSVIQMIEEQSPKAASENITRTYTSEELQLLAITDTGSVMTEVSSAPRSLYAVNRYFPIEHLRKVNDRLIYVVYKAKDADTPEYYIYLFFEKLSPVGEAAKEAPENAEKWFLLDRVFYVSKTLEMKDFGQIKTGSSVLDVQRIDPLSSIYVPQDVGEVSQEVYDFELEEYVTQTYTPAPVLSYQTYHYTTDGIVCITFEREDVSNEYVVKNVGYNETFEMPSNTRKGTVSLTIDAMDLP